MTKFDLSQFLAQSQRADGPSVPASLGIQPGGVDPLGLRQLNFDLMDEVIPGLNNVARHVRPFVVVAWASRQAIRITKSQDRLQVSGDELCDFIDRIEVIYAWSQFLRDRSAELPGGQVLSGLLNETSYRFGGPKWTQRRKTRQGSTSFTAPISYGPALKALGWVSPHPEYPAFLRANTAADAALDAFEETIAGYLDHPAFSRLGDVTVKAGEVRIWADAWSLDEVSVAEQEVAAEFLAGAPAPAARRESVELMLSAISQLDEPDDESIRKALCDHELTFTPPKGSEEVVARWRRLQVRQLFRLTLEALLYWIIWCLDDGPMTTPQLVDTFLSECDGWPNDESVAPWKAASNAQNPVDLMRRIETALRRPDGVDLASSLAAALAFCLAEPVSSSNSRQQDSRLPLSRAVREANAWSQASGPTFLTHVIESWVLAQHVYWAVGRSLGEARGNGSQILRLRVVLDDGGWAQAPGVKRGSLPYPTPDRLSTALNLVWESGLWDEAG